MSAPSHERRRSATLADVLAAGGARLPGLLARVEARLAELAAGHGAELARHAGATIAAGGKRLRPLLVLLAADVGRQAGRDAAAVRAAVAVELVHSATLVHDDVLDRASVRRGRPTVVARAGRAMATATGDLLFSRAFAELSCQGCPASVRALSVAASALAEGELLQRADAFDLELSEERYLTRCQLKTASLFDASARLGALAAGLPAAARQVEALGAFGARIGVAFQLLDDVLDVEGPAERTGKTRGADLLDGTVTLPLILARGCDPELGALGLREVVSPAAAERVCERIAATGVLEDVRARALDLVAEAKAGLPELPAAQRAVLELVADATVARYS